MSPLHFQCILLAAGRGTRLGGKTEQLPKSLLLLDGKPLCHHIIDSLITQFATDLLVVGGFQFVKLQEALKQYKTDLHIIENKEYEKGNLLTLLKARPFVDRTFVVFNADHFYSDKILGQIFEAAQTVNTIIIACDSDRTLSDDDMKVEIDDAGHYVRMEKNLTHYQWGYVGVTCVPKNLLEAYWQSCERVLASVGEGANVEKVVNELVLAGYQVKIIDVSGSHWLEVDTEEDYRRAEKQIKVVLADKNSG